MNEHGCEQTVCVCDALAFTMRGNIQQSSNATSMAFCRRSLLSRSDKRMHACG